MSQISLRNIEKIYEGSTEPSVKDFNLEIEDKEFIVFVGPSGCGKSTTLRMIAGLETISGGELYIKDKLVNKTPPKDRDIAMVFQNYALYPHLSVYENMAFGLKLRKVPKNEIKERIADAAETLGLTDFLKRKPSALSGGQRQRVALGRAIVREAPIFLMDEPLSNLDAKLRVQMRAEITRLHKHLNNTIIYVTHDQTEAMTMATRIVVMKDGVIQQIGAPIDVYNTPNNVFVASFIGTPAMNFFHGKIEGSSFVSDDFTIGVPEGHLKTLTRDGYQGKSIILGIRPEDIKDDPITFDAYPDYTIQSTTIVAELTGAEFLLHSKIGKTNFTARVNSRTIHKANEQTSLVLEMSKAHFFDAETEQRLSL
ncbi:sugar ABC transporter ATP-binding protein [Brochothrix thermosphacta]|uniref:ABC transporter ATP-binding protein n=1 Tax=Brochothrix thermosphacta TaxID=2756 RepID=UPI000E726A52|nr:sn-glycerol-3-phosphate ABC transporter ATP-binding protein UgpC [Brochothrix thermosphacta]ANZ95717.1 sugar ABC transporter ATP-binding protein [Brochothrix thermosphacta]